MKFTKTAIALAIAGIAAAPMIASADTTLSGAVQLKLQGSDADGDAGDMNIGAGDVILGISASQELNSGLTGYGSLRHDMDQLSNTQSGAVNLAGEGVKTAGSVDSVYVGIKGGFGDVRMGEIPLAVEYGQVANDIFDVGGEINGGLSYTGTFGPVGLVANFSPEPNSDAVGIGAKFGIGGFSIGLGAEDRAERQNMSAGVTFSAGGASVAAHFWTKETAGDDDESMSVKVGYGFGGVSAALTFSTLEGASGDKEAIRLDLGYGLGGGMDVSTRITATTDNDASANDLTEWRLQLAKSF